jgi:exosortase/archaeosortase family protein
VTWPLMQVSVALYLCGFLWMQRQRWQLILYVWGVFGFVFLAIHLVILQEWHIALAGMEALHVQMLLYPIGLQLQVIDATTFLIPDGTGWSALNISIECSTIIELAVFAGLVLFYPKLSMRQRWKYLVIGAAGTYLLNLARILIIVLMIDLWGKPAVPLAHTVVGRTVYFVGVVGLYWYLLTKPTLHIVRRNIETTGRAVR